MVKFTSWRPDLKVSVRQRWSKSISSGLAAGHRQYRHLFQDAESHSDPDLLPDTVDHDALGGTARRAIEARDAGCRRNPYDILFALAA